MLQNYLFPLKLNKWNLNSRIVQIFTFLEHSYYLDWFFSCKEKGVKWNLLSCYLPDLFFSLSYLWTRVLSCSWGDKFMVSYISFCLAPSFEKDFILYSLHMKTLKYILHLAQDLIATVCIQATYIAENKKKKSCIFSGILVSVKYSQL